VRARDSQSHDVKHTWLRIAQKSPISPQKSPISPQKCSRATVNHTMWNTHGSVLRNRALFPRKRSLYSCRTALYSHKRPSHKGARARQSLNIARAKAREIQRERDSARARQPITWYVPYSVKESYFHTKEPYFQRDSACARQSITRCETHMAPYCAKEPYFPAKEPYFPTKDLHTKGQSWLHDVSRIPASEPYTRIKTALFSHKGALFSRKRSLCSRTDTFMFPPKTFTPKGACATVKHTWLSIP